MSASGDGENCPSGWDDADSNVDGTRSETQLNKNNNKWMNNWKYTDISIQGRKLIDFGESVLNSETPGVWDTNLEKLNKYRVHATGVSLPVSAHARTL